jgi:predicted nucleotidyltransferase
MATVSTYLSELADGFVFSENQKNQIKTSVQTIKDRLEAYFSKTIYSVKEIRIFGSYDRNTIINNKDVDVDIMVLFENSQGYTPQTYLNKLKEFANNSYSQSINAQSNPAIKISLNHITFELVPAYQKYLQYGIKSYFIPKTSNNTFSFEAWEQTEFDFNKKIKEACNNSKNIYRLILLMKSWCSKNNYISSYKLEQFIVEQYYYNCNTLFDYISTFVDNTNWKVDNKLKVLKDYMDKAKEYKNNGDENNAIEELKKINF